MLAEKNEDIRKAYDLLQVMSKDEKSRMAYEAREAEIHDQMTRIKTAREEGINIGIDIGKDKGANDKAIKIAENLLQMGLNIEQVAIAAEISIEKVEEIKKQILN